jgi:hypothetical protein
MRWMIVASVVCLASCTGGDGGGSFGIPSDYCDRLGALDCGGEGTGAADCHSECDGETLVEGSPSDCWEMGCAVAVNTCAEDEAGRRAWMSCLVDHGVAQACSRLEDYCMYECYDGSPDGCDSVVADADEGACGDFHVSHEFSADACVIE